MTPADPPVLTIRVCPHCTLEVASCGLGMPELDLGHECKGYVHKHNGQHACNPANPVYVAENPRTVIK